MSTNMKLFNYVYDSVQDRKVLKIWREDDSYSGGYWDEATDEEIQGFIDFINNSNRIVGFSEEAKP